MSDTPSETWAVVELMGYTVMAGRLTEVTRFGTQLGCVEIPLPGGGFCQQLFGGQSLYRLTYCTEEEARGVAAHQAPRRPQLPAPREDAYYGLDDEDEGDEDEDEGDFVDCEDINPDLRFGLSPDDDLNPNQGA